MKKDEIEAKTLDLNGEQFEIDSGVIVDHLNRETFGEGEIVEVVIETPFKFRPGNLQTLNGVIVEISKTGSGFIINDVVLGKRPVNLEKLVSIQTRVDWNPSRDEVATDMVNHPPHYQSDNGIECIEAIRAALGDEGFVAYCRGNAIKYIWREKADSIEDRNKAIWYLNKANEVAGELLAGSDNG